MSPEAYYMAESETVFKVPSPKNCGPITVMVTAKVSILERVPCVKTAYLKDILKE